MRHLRYSTLLFVMLLLSIHILFTPVHAQSSEVYDRDAALDWAYEHNPNNGCYPKLPGVINPNDCGHYSPEYIAGMLLNGGLTSINDLCEYGTPNCYVGIHQIIAWMKSHQYAWEFVEADGLERADFVLFSLNDPSVMDMTKDNIPDEDHRFLHTVIPINDPDPDDPSDLSARSFASWNRDFWDRSFDTMRVSSIDPPPLEYYQYTRFVHIILDKVAKVDTFVWEDSNGNGFQDAGESGIADIGVSFFRVGNPDPVITPPQKTDSTGHVRYTLLPNDDGEDVYFTIDPEALLDAGYTITTAHQDKPQSNNLSDSDFGQLDGHTNPVTLLQNIPEPNVDLGLLKIVDCQAMLDLMIVLDFSTPPDYDAQNQDRNFASMRYFTKSIVRGLSISADLAHIGVVQFSPMNDAPSSIHSTTPIALGQYLNRSQLLQAVDTVLPSPSNRASSIWQGITLAETEFNSTRSRPLVPHAIILVTDGNQTDQNIDFNAVPKARQLWGQGIKIYLVKINFSGSNYDDGVARGIVAPSGAVDFYLLDGVTDANSKVLLEPTSLTGVLNTLLSRLCGDSIIPNQYSTTTPTLTWSPTTGAIGYNVQVSRNKTFTDIAYTGQVTTNTPYLTVTQPPLANGAYCWRVQAVMTTQTGTWSAPTCFAIYEE